MFEDRDHNGMRLEVTENFYGRQPGFTVELTDDGKQRLAYYGDPARARELGTALLRLADYLDARGAGR